MSSRSSQWVDGWGSEVGMSETGTGHRLQRGRTTTRKATIRVELTTLVVRYVNPVGPVHGVLILFSPLLTTHQISPDLLHTDFNSIRHC